MQEEYYEESEKYLRQLTKLEDYSNFKEEAESAVEICLMVNPELSFISSELQSPSKFQLNDFYTRAFTVNFEKYKTWIEEVHLVNKNSIDKVMLRGIMKELDRMKLRINSEISEGALALKNIELEQLRIKEYLK
jgi:hypothetical protein